MATILGILYFPLSYWAMNKLWWSKHQYLYADGFNFYLQRWLTCLFLGFITIPVALIISVIGMVVNRD